MSVASGSDKRQRTRLIAVRFLPKEAEAVSTAAELAGLSVGAYLRTVALGRPGPRAVRRPPVEKKELARILGQLGKIGTNVNQIARRLNSDGVTPAPPEMARMLEDLRSMRNVVLALQKHRP